MTLVLRSALTKVSKSDPQGASELQTRYDLSRIPSLQLDCPSEAKFATIVQELRRTNVLLSNLHCYCTNLAVDDDGCVDVGAEERLDDGVEVGLEGGGRVADGDAVVGQPGELLLHALHHRVQSLKKQKFSQTLQEIESYFELFKQLPSILKHVVKELSCKSILIPEMWIGWYNLYLLMSS